MNLFSAIRHSAPTSAVLAIFLSAATARAQDTIPPRPTPPAAAPDTTRALQDTTRAVRDTTTRMLSPGGAFVRSLIIPGWGQASVGAYKRGGVFFAIQSASWYMLLKTLARLEDAREKEAHRVAFVSDSLRLLMADDTALARELADPDTFALRVGSSGRVTGARALIASRERQRQDWITYTLFFTLASGLDAFIAAQLADFPATITTRPAPTGGVQLRLELPFPRRL